MVRDLDERFKRYLRKIKEMGEYEIPGASEVEVCMILRRLLQRVSTVDDLNNWFYGSVVKANNHRSKI